MNKSTMIMFLIPMTFMRNLTVIGAIQNNDIQIKEINRTQNSTTFEIIKNNNVKRIKLPDGNWTVNDKVNYTVNRNGLYEFLYETTSNTINTISQNISGLRSEYLITPIVDVRLKLTAQDSLSGLDSMQFKNEGNGIWTNYEKYSAVKEWRLDDVEGLKTVFVKYKDVAGNETSEIFDKIIYDKSGPDITKFVINNNAQYTKDQNVLLNINALDNFGEVSKLLISNDNKNWVTKDFTDTIPWTLLPGAGMKTVYIKASDFSGNIGSIATDTIYFDNVLPTGTIKINNDNSITNSKDVKLQIAFDDVHSGIKRVTVIEKDKIYNLPNISTSPIEIDWRLLGGDTGQVMLEIEDIAGNIYITNSNIIKISTLSVSQFRLTDIVNPSIYPINKPFKPITWTFAPKEMKAGANISFDINYILDIDDKTTAVMNGSYYIEIINEQGYHKIIESNYNGTVSNGFKTTITIPNDTPDNSKIYLSSKIISTLTTNNKTFINEVVFPNKNEKALIGITKGNIKNEIIFNEIN